MWDQTPGFLQGRQASYQPSYIPRPSFVFFSIISKPWKSLAFCSLWLLSFASGNFIHCWYYSRIWSLSQTPSFMDSVMYSTTDFIWISFWALSFFLTSFFILFIHCVFYIMPPNPTHPFPIKQKRKKRGKRKGKISSLTLQCDAASHKETLYSYFFICSHSLQRIIGHMTDEQWKQLSHARNTGTGSPVSLPIGVLSLSEYILENSLPLQTTVL